MMKYKTTMVTKLGAILLLSSVMNAVYTLEPDDWWDSYDWRDHASMENQENQQTPQEHQQLPQEHQQPFPDQEVHASQYPQFNTLPPVDQSSHWNSNQQSIQNQNVFLNSLGASSSNPGIDSNLYSDWNSHQQNVQNQNVFFNSQGAGSSNLADNSNFQAPFYAVNPEFTEDTQAYATDDADLYAVVAASGNLTSGNQSSYTTGLSAGQSTYGSGYGSNDHIAAMDLTSSSISPYGTSGSHYGQSDETNEYQLADLYLETLPFMQDVPQLESEYPPQHIYPDNTVDVNVASSSNAPHPMQYNQGYPVSDFQNEILISNENDVSNFDDPNGCRLPIDTLPENHGLFHHHLNNEATLYPTFQNLLEIPHESKFQMTCLDSIVKRYKALSVLTIACNAGVFYEVDVDGNVLNRKLQIRDFECFEVPPYKLRIVQHSKECGKYLHYQMGFASYSYPKLFKVLYNLCIDRSDNKDRTLYTWYTVDKTIRGRQEFKMPEKYGRPNHGRSEKGFYNMHSATDKRYRWSVVCERLLEQVGVENIHKLTNGYKSKVTKGHLASRLDFVYRVEQASALHYKNVLPMWDDLEKNWQKLETAIAKFAAHREGQLTIYTGTSELQMFQKSESKTIPLYLYYLKEVNMQEYVPYDFLAKYFWKVVYDPASLKCVIFVGNNSATLFEQRCTDVTATVGWMNLEIDTAILYACNCDDYRPEILPKFPLLRDPRGY